MRRQPWAATRLQWNMWRRPGVLHLSNAPLAPICSLVPQPHLPPVTELVAPLMEKEDEDEWFATPSPPSLDTSVVPGGVPQEPKGARPTNRRPAHSKTAATRAATSGVEPPEEQMASGGHGRTLMRMSL
mmetsp:Transcript_59320/g.193496  ORF Transcript_59320/g.193496 Transcript_59320/m.193496 type:complete len:129 (-) Transcript_59320:160-546(-)